MQNEDGSTVGIFHRLAGPSSTGAEMESQHSDAINTHTGVCVCVCRRVRALGNINRQQVRSAPKDVEERGNPKKEEEIGGHFYSVASSGDARAICRRQIIHCAAQDYMCVCTCGCVSGLIKSTGSSRSFRFLVFARKWRRRPC